MLEETENYKEKQLKSNKRVHKKKIFRTGLVKTNEFEAYTVTLKNNQSVQRKQCVKPAKCIKVKKELQIKLVRCDEENNKRLVQTDDDSESDLVMKNLNVGPRLPREVKWGHKLNHKILAKFKCDICGISCTNKSTLDMHMKKHFSYTLNTNTARLQDLYGTKNGIYTCYLCYSIFRSQISVMGHLNIHLNAKEPVGPVLRCKFCPVFFTDSALYSNHSKPAMSRKYVCKVCPNKAFSSVCLFACHASTHGNILDQDTIRTLLDNKGNNVKSSFKNYVEISKKKSTLITEEPRNHSPVKCGVCDAKFTTKLGLFVHKKSHTAEEAEFSLNMKIKAEKPFQLSGSNLNIPHVPVGKPSLQIQRDSDLNNDTADGKEETDEVKMIIAGPKSLLCPFCGLEFRSRAFLIAHKNLHKQNGENMTGYYNTSERERDSGSSQYQEENHSVPASTIPSDNLEQNLTMATELSEKKIATATELTEEIDTLVTELTGQNIPMTTQITNSIDFGQNSSLPRNKRSGDDHISDNLTKTAAIVNTSNAIEIVPESLGAPPSQIETVVRQFPEQETMPCTIEIIPDNVKERLNSMQTIEISFDDSKSAYSVTDGILPDKDVKRCKDRPVDDVHDEVKCDKGIDEFDSDVITIDDGGDEDDGDEDDDGDKAELLEKNLKDVLNKSNVDSEDVNSNQKSSDEKTKVSPKFKLRHVFNFNNCNVCHKEFYNKKDFFAHKNWHGCFMKKLKKSYDIKAKQLTPSKVQKHPKRIKSKKLSKKFFPNNSFKHNIFYRKIVEKNIKYSRQLKLKCSGSREKVTNGKKEAAECPVYLKRKEQKAPETFVCQVPKNWNFMWQKKDVTESKKHEAEERDTVRDLKSSVVSSEALFLLNRCNVCFLEFHDEASLQEHKNQKHRDLFISEECEVKKTPMSEDARNINRSPKTELKSEILIHLTHSPVCSKYKRDYPLRDKIRSKSKQNVHSLKRNLKIVLVRCDPLISYNGRYKSKLRHH